MAIGNALKQGIFVVAAKRTPFGTFGGTLKSHTPTDLQVSKNICINLLRSAQLHCRGRSTTQQ